MGTNSDAIASLTYPLAFWLPKDAKPPKIAVQLVAISEAPVDRLYKLTSKMNSGMRNELDAFRLGGNPKAITALAKFKKEIVGWAFAHGYPEDQRWKQTFEVGIFVSPEYRRLGFGTQLMGSLSEYMRGSGPNSVIHVRPRDEKGVRFFRQFDTLNLSIELT